MPLKQGLLCFKTTNDSINNIFRHLIVTPTITLKKVVNLLDVNWQLSHGGKEPIPRNPHITRGDLEEKEEIKQLLNININQIENIYTAIFQGTLVVAWFGVLGKFVDWVYLCWEAQYHKEFSEGDRVDYEEWDATGWEDCDFEPDIVCSKEYDHLWFYLKGCQDLWVEVL